MATKKHDGGGGSGAKKPAARKAAPKTDKPKIRASHAASEGPRPRRSAPGGGSGGPRPAGGDRARARSSGTPQLKSSRAATGARKAPLGAPKRAPGARKPTETVTPEASTAARELALALAAAGLEKKAIGIEILDVSGRVDYAEYIVVMTGRSDRHVHAIAQGLEEGVRNKKIAPLSIEGLGTATWVLIDFNDVVVHVFQEEARALYDIEGLWIDAGRVPVPNDGAAVESL